MYAFPELMKLIREEAGLTQPEFADILKISNSLVAMVETGQKEVSRKLINKIADVLDVHPASITPFAFLDKKFSKKNLSKTEQYLLVWGDRMQEYLIKEKSKKIRKYGN